MNTQKEENTKRLNVAVKLKVSDVLRYNMYIAYRSKISKLMVLVGLAFLGYFIYSMVTTTLSLDVFISKNFILLLVPILLLVAKPWKVWTITATQMQSPIFSGTNNYTFTSEHINLKVGELEDTVPWETYSSIVETKHDFRFFVDPVQAQIVPKHVMTKEQIKHLKKIIESANPETVYKFK